MVVLCARSLLSRSKLRCGTRGGWYTGQPGGVNAGTGRVRGPISIVEIGKHCSIPPGPRRLQWSAYRREPALARPLETPELMCQARAVAAITYLASSTSRSSVSVGCCSVSRSDHQSKVSPHVEAITAHNNIGVGSQTICCQTVQFTGTAVAEASQEPGCRRAVRPNRHRAPADPTHRRSGQIQRNSLIETRGGPGERSPPARLSAATMRPGLTAGRPDRLPGCCAGWESAHLKFR